MRETANRLFGDDYQWSVLGAGRHQMSLLTLAAIQGANVRVAERRGVVDWGSRFDMDARFFSGIPVEKGTRDRHGPSSRQAAPGRTAVRSATPVP